MKKTFQLKKSLLLCTLGSSVILVGCNSGSSSSSTTSTTPTYVYTTTNTANTLGEINQYKLDSSTGKAVLASTIPAPSLSSGLNQASNSNFQAVGLQAETFEPDPTLDYARKRTLLDFISTLDSSSNSSALTSILEYPLEATALGSHIGAVRGWANWGAYSNPSNSKIIDVALCEALTNSNQQSALADVPRALIFADNQSSALEFYKLGDTVNMSTINFTDIGIPSTAGWAITKISSAQAGYAQIEMRALDTNGSENYRIYNFGFKYDGSAVFTPTGPATLVYSNLVTDTDIPITSSPTIDSPTASSLGVAGLGARITTLNTQVAGGELDLLDAGTDGSLTRQTSLQPAVALATGFNCQTAQQCALSLSDASYIDRLDIPEGFSSLIATKLETNGSGRLAIVSWPSSDGAKMVFTDLPGNIYAYDLGVK